MATSAFTVKKQPPKVSVRYDAPPFSEPRSDKVTTEPACSGQDYDPEWWVHEHSGRCSRDCPHGLAVHICINHCPLLEQCQSIAAQNPEQWGGMVMGGLVWTATGKVGQPPMRSRCSACPPREKVFHDGTT